MIRAFQNNHHATKWGYDVFVRQTSKTNALGAVIIQYAFDADNRLTNRWMMGTNTGYTYDAVGNRKTIVYPQLTITNLYDAIDELTNMSDAAGTTKFTYTGTRKIASETSPWASSTISFAYNQGRRTNLSLTQPSGTWAQSYTYDAEWRMATLTSPAGEFIYASGATSGASPLIKSLSLPNGALITNAYDNVARFASTALLNYWNHPLDGYAYTVNTLGLRTGITRQLGLTTNTITVSYDPINQLTNWSGKESSSTLRHNEQLAYAYDSAGNLRARTNDALIQTFAVDALNQLSNVTRTGTLTVSGATPVPATSVTVNGAAAQTNGDFTFARTNVTLSNGTNTFTNIAQNIYGLHATNLLTVNLPTNVLFQYDANGNLTNDGLRVLSYDAENQLTNIFATNAWRVGFVYDGLNRLRIEKDYTWQTTNWQETNEIRFIYDGRLVVQERDTNNYPQVTYTRGLDLSDKLPGAGLPATASATAGGIGGLLARTDTNGPTYYHADANGNITALMDGNENIVARAEYDGYGRFVKLEGSLANANRYWFSSKEYIRQAGLYYYGFRFLDVNFGRWLNRDPIGEAGGIYLYRFNYNSPVDFVDSNGEGPTGTIGGAGIGGAIGGAVGVVVGGLGGTLLLPGGGTVAGAAGLGELGVGVGAAVGAAVGNALENIEDLFAQNNSSGTTYNGQPTDQYGNKLGPSGKPMRHAPKCPTRKSAQDAAQEAGGGNPPVEHPNPADGSPPHFHPGDADGNKVPGSPHYQYPQ